MKTRLLAFLLVCAGSTATAALPQQHCGATLDVAIEAKRITLRLGSHVDNLAGSVRAPSTAAGKLDMAKPLHARDKVSHANIEADFECDCADAARTLQ